MKQILDEVLGDDEFDLDEEDEQVPEQTEATKVPPKCGKGAAAKEPLPKWQKKGDPRPNKPIQIDEGVSTEESRCCF